MEARKPVSEFEIISHGCMWSDYFQGCGIAGTGFDEVSTGAGETEKSAFEDALEQLASSGWETDTLQDEGKKANGKDLAEGDDCHYYVSVRVKG